MTQDKYKEFISSIAKSGENRTFLNSDENHALEVLIQLFQIAQSEIRIFAGCLCKHVGNQPEYIVALSEFIERGGTLHILLNKFDEDSAKTSNLYKRLAYYKSKGYPILIKKTNLRPYRTEDTEKQEVHFTIGDNCAYRIETDIEKRTAECNFANPILANQFAVFFDSLFERSDSEEIDIIKLFDNDNK